MGSNLTVDIYLITAIASVSIGLFCLVYLISSKLIANNGNKILAYLLVLSIAFVSYNFLVHSKLIYKLPWFFMFGRHLDILIYLLLFSYFDTFKNNKKVLLKRVYWRLFIAFLFILLIKNPWYHLSSTSYQHYILDQFYSDTRPGPISIWKSTLFFWLKFMIPLVLLLFAGHRMIYYVLPKLKDTLVKSLLILSFSILFLFVLLSNWLFEVLYKFTKISFIEWPIELLTLSFVQVVLVFYAIKVNDFNTSYSKYSNSSLSSIDKSDFLVQLTALMENDKAYLNPKVTLKKVADILKINTTYLSEAINSEGNSSFSNFLNRYRVEEAKKLLKNPENNKYTIDSIAQKSGFKSTSAFYRAFRKHTDMSPNQFKRSIF